MRDLASVVSACVDDYPNGTRFTGDIAKLAAQTSPTHSAQPPTNALPVPWREVLDKKSGRFYYVNEYVI